MMKKDRDDWELDGTVLSMEIFYLGVDEGNKNGRDRSCQ